MAEHTNDMTNLRIRRSNAVETSFRSPFYPADHGPFKKTTSLSPVRKNELNQLLPSISNCIEKNSIVELRRLLFLLQSDEIHYLMSLTYTSGDQIMTPLMAATRKNRGDIVHELVQRYSIPVDQIGTIKFDDERPIRGASVLWCACTLGNMDVIKLLVDHGANVNFRTATESTPLRPACFEGHLPVVKYLLDCGADINSSSVYYKNTNLMVACYRCQANVVRCLLERNVNVNAQDFRGRSALHIACEVGHLQIAQMLIKYGINTNLRDNRGATALHVACEYTNEDIVMFMMKYTDMDFNSQIATLELLGASFAHSDKAVSYERFAHYLSEALKARNSRGIRKHVTKIDAPVYNNQVEFTTEDELASFRYSLDAMVLQSYLIKERILGGVTISTFPMLYRGAVYADSMNYEQAIACWEKALQISNVNKQRLTEDLGRLMDLLYEIRSHNEDISRYKPMIYDLLKYASEEVKKVQGLFQRYDNIHDMEMPAIINSMKYNAYHFLCFLDLLVDDSGTTGDPQLDYKVCKHVYQVLQNNIPLRGHSLGSFLHIACQDDNVTDVLGKTTLVVFPNLKLVRLLLHCGANVHNRDAFGNTPLHNTVKAELSAWDVITLLIEHGANVGSCNKAGERPIDCHDRAVNRAITLKMLSAVAVSKNVCSVPELMSANLLPVHLCIYVKECSKYTTE